MSIMTRPLLVTTKAVPTGGAGITYVGSITDSPGEAGNFNSSGEALDVLSIASTGDLVVIAMTLGGAGDASAVWEGMAFTSLSDNMDNSAAGNYLGYRVVQGGDSNPYINTSTGPGTDKWDGLSVAASVFSLGGASLTGATATEASGSSSAPNPPNLTGTGNLWIASGHTEALAASGITAPTDYTLATSVQNSSSRDSTTAIAYRIASLTDQNPAAFGSGGSDDWRAVTARFDIS